MNKNTKHLIFRSVIAILVLAIAAVLAMVDIEIGLFIQYNAPQIATYQALICSTISLDLVIAGGLVAGLWITKSPS